MNYATLLLCLQINRVFELLLLFLYLFQVVVCFTMLNREKNVQFYHQFYNCVIHALRARSYSIPKSIYSQIFYK